MNHPSPHSKSANPDYLPASIIDGDPENNRAPINKIESKNITLDSDYIPEGFISDYLNWVRPSTDAPDEFHVTSILAAMAGVCGNKIWVTWGINDIYPNLWALLLGGSSRLRKSTCINAIKILLQQLEANFNVDEKIVKDHYHSTGLKITADEASQRAATIRQNGYVYPTDFSKEGFLQNLPLRPYGIITFSEFGGFLASCEKQYMFGTKELLTELFDTPPTFHRELRSGSIHVVRPCISILGASTLEWFERQLTEADKWSGFLQRFSFCTIHTPTKPSLAICPPLDSHTQNRIVKQFSEIAGYKGRRTISPEACDIYVEWKEGNGRELDRSVNEQLLGSYVQRIEITALKIAMLIEASWGDNTEISPEAMSHALGISDYFKSNAISLISDGLSFSRIDKLKKRVLDIVHSHGGQTTLRIVKQNLRQVNSSRERDDIIRMLEDEGKIVVYDVVKFSGQPSRMIKLGPE